MKSKPEIAPAKLVKFLRGLYVDLIQIEAITDGADLPDKFFALVAEVIEDVGDQLLFIGYELKPKERKEVKLDIQKLREAYKKAHPRA